MTMPLADKFQRILEDLRKQGEAAGAIVRLGRSRMEAASGQVELGELVGGTG
jgi:hypothetical protein